ncbi:MAG TPA: hypothetical protein VHX39_20780 [Acetobacteraceae bacterium]|nr:hypothetical protein [Acetobacteraceae bacterium]
MAAVIGRPSCLPFSRAWTSPARVPSRRISRSKSVKDRQPAGHRATGWRSEIQRFGQRDETDTEILQFLEGREQVRHRPSPAIQPPHQHYIDCAAPRGLDQLLTGLPLDNTRTDLAHLHCDGPAAPGAYSRRARFCMGSGC